MAPFARGARLRLCLRRLGQARVRFTLRYSPSNVNLPYSTLQLTGVKCDKLRVDDRCHLNFLSREFTTKYASSKLLSGQPSQPKVKASKSSQSPVNLSEKFYLFIFSDL